MRHVHRKTGIGLGGGPVFGIEGITLPVGGRYAVIQTLPPGLIVVGDADIGEYRIVIQHRQGAGVGVFGRSRRDAKKARFRVNGPHASVITHAHPADIVTNRPYLPALITGGRYQHGQVGLAAS